MGAAVTAGPPLWVCDLGLVPYQAAWDLQKALAAARAQEAIPDCLLLLEHPHIFTLGRSGQSTNLVWDEAERARRGVALAWVDRGGDVTYHGPGQLVGYPLMRLAQPLDLIAYVRDLEAALIRAVGAYGVRAERRAGYTGVWLPGATPDAPSEKLAAIGVRFDARGVTSHGFALNVTTDLSYFDGIIPCGITAETGGVTSLARVLGRALPLASVRAAVAKALAAVFARTPVAVPAAEVWARAGGDEP